MEASTTYGLIHRANLVILFVLAIVLSCTFLRPNYGLQDSPNWALPGSNASVDDFNDILNDFVFDDFVPATSEMTRMLITGGVPTKPPSWTRQLPLNMNYTYFPVRSPSPRSGTHEYVNKGNEAMFYLTYIIQNYEQLPDYMIFTHDHKRAWHNSDSSDRSILSLLAALRWDYIAQQGFVNLRCETRPNCPEVPALHHLFRAGPLEVSFAYAWQEIFQAKFGALDGRSIGAPCCAQFVVTRDAVRLNTLQFYENARRWIETSDGSDFMLGRMFEYTWHIIFGKEFVLCPDTDVCREKLYGVEELDF